MGSAVMKGNLKLMEKLLFRTFLVEKEYPFL